MGGPSINVLQVEDVIYMVLSPTALEPLAGSNPAAPGPDPCAHGSAANGSSALSNIAWLRGPEPRAASGAGRSQTPAAAAITKFWSGLG